MLVLGVNSKRHRRPNVRLVEIGDASAALACGISQKRPKEDRVQHLGLFPAPVLLPRVSAESHNRENRNPNSGKIEWDLSSSNFADGVKLRLDSEAAEPEPCDFGEGNTKLNSNIINLTLGGGAATPKLNSGKVTKKGRAMKRRVKSSKGNGGIGSVWTSMGNPGICNGNNRYADERLKGSFASDVSKDACVNEFLEPALDVAFQEDSDGYWMGNGCKENTGLTSYNVVFSDYKLGAIVNNARVWLEEHGFSKYVGLFQMHEVDEETLPLLTLEDLKEMGINAVGIRRKIFTEIQLLKERASA